MDKLKMHSPDLSQENIEKIRSLFPNCVTEANDENGKLKLAIDFDQLKQELSNSIVEGPQERYHLNWPGKRDALLTANAPIAKTLRPCRDESVNFDTTENLFIEGDNLEALKLLQETYLGKVKMIYIDPPYNTGSDFVYKDDFSENTQDFLSKSNQIDADHNKLVSNPESNGRFHSFWLSMIYSRLKLARNLLTNDGVVFISIGDDEVHNLKAVCNEIFGENNFITEFCWEKKKKPSFLNKNLGSKFEYILCFSKNREATKAFSVELTEQGKKYPFNNAGNSIGVLEFPAGYVDFNLPDQVISPQDMSEGKIVTELLDEVIVKNGKNQNSFRLKGEWRYSPQKLNEIILNNEKIIISKVPFRPNHIKPGGEIKKMHNLLTIKHYGIATNEDADAELAKLFGVSYFDYAKPTGLIKLLIKALMYDDHDGIVMDFFAGSATTADAVLQLNYEQGTNRKFILVQVPEECSINSQAFKDGFETIPEVGRERIRRVAKEYTDKRVGFRSLKIDSSNMTDVFYRPDQINQSDMFAQVENIKEDRTDEDLLFQVLLDWGVGLTLPISKHQITSKDVFFVNADEDGEGADLIACFSRNISNELIKELAEKQPLRVVFRDDGFANDSVKINVEQIFKQISPMTDVKSI
ncbi:site-specific DNA-methyltransferase [Colwellia sp. MEBiC06753]